MDARSFFEQRLPTLLAERKRQSNHPRISCLFEIDGDGGGRWWVEFANGSARVDSTDYRDADCVFQMTNADFVSLLADPAEGQILAWQGKLRVRGTRESLQVVTELLFPTIPNQYDSYYVSLMRLVPSLRLIFMNHGYAAETDQFDWLREDDLLWRYSINLVRQVIGDFPLSGRRVLETGCGRGGPCSYLVRYHQPALVVGLDACQAAAVFCQHRHPEAGLTFLAGRAEQLPFRLRSFDVVLNVESAHCYPDLAPFFAEVARVLVPGGLFCYADTFSTESFERVTGVLSLSRALRLIQSSDITAGVCRAIERNRQTFSDLLCSMVDPNLHNFALIAHLICSVNVEMLAKYRSGEWRYHLWLFERVGES